MCVFLLVVILMLTGCTKTAIQSYSDELVSSLWSATLDNETRIMLSFAEDDTATLKMKLKGEKELSISGFCEVSDTIFVIYDDSTGVPYAFEYMVHFDRVILKFSTNTVSLYKT